MRCTNCTQFISVHFVAVYTVQASTLEMACQRTRRSLNAFAVCHDVTETTSIISRKLDQVVSMCLVDAVDDRRRTFQPVQAPKVNRYRRHYNSSTQTFFHNQSRTRATPVILLVRGSVVKNISVRRRKGIHKKWSGVTRPSTTLNPFRLQ